jgi:hypothetical protein
MRTDTSISMTGQAPNPVEAKSEPPPQSSKSPKGDDRGMCTFPLNQDLQLTCHSFVDIDHTSRLFAEAVLTTDEFDEMTDYKFYAPADPDEENQIAFFTRSEALATRYPELLHRLVDVQRESNAMLKENNDILERDNGILKKEISERDELIVELEKQVFETIKIRAELQKRKSENDKIIDELKAKLATARGLVEELLIRLPGWMKWRRSKRK